MDPTPTPPPSPSYQRASDRLIQLAIDHVLAGAQPIATRPDGRQQYELPNGMRVVLSPKRQAKKALMRQGLTSRQYRHLKRAEARLRKEQDLTPASPTA